MVAEQAQSKGWARWKDGKGCCTELLREGSMIGHVLKRRPEASALGTVGAPETPWGGAAEAADRHAGVLRRNCSTYHIPTLGSA